MIKESTINLKEIQKKSLGMYLYFHEFCDKHGLLHYFCGGCCIGAIRHKGFIPWDDDIDVFMPRGDYERLKNLWKMHANNTRYLIMFPNEQTINHNLFITIADAETTYIRPYQKDLDVPHGLVLDIFPLDGYPSSRLARFFQVMWALVYSLFCAQLVPEKHGKIVKLLANVLLKLIHSNKMRYKIWRFAEKQMTKHDFWKTEYITELCAGPHYMMKKYPQGAFVNTILKEFEGYMLPIPIGYDDYLNIAFGDYMKLPPKDKQIAHHDALFVDLERSYKHYKGKYYCVESEN